MTDKTLREYVREEAEKAVEAVEEGEAAGTEEYDQDECRAIARDLFVRVGLRCARKALEEAAQIADLPEPPDSAIVQDVAPYMWASTVIARLIATRIRALLAREREAGK